MNEIKLLALDLDGTLLNSRGEISKGNLSAIKLAEESGVFVTIATGRRFRDALPVAFSLELNAPIITHNGTLIKHAETLETINVRLISTPTVREILRVGREFGVDAMLSADPHGKGVLLYDTLSEHNIPLKKYIAWAKRLHGAEADEAVHHVESLDKIAPDVETIHISFSGGCALMAELVLILERELGESVKILTTVYTALNFTLIDILPPESSKGFGLKNLADSLALTSSNVMAIGDNFNDLEMLEFAETAVVMGNAMPELLENENYHSTLSNDEDGVALAIEKFILES